MFISEQYLRQNPKNSLKKGSFKAGTPLVKGKSVKTSFTYKELSLIVGIIVAIIIIFTLWVNQMPFEQSSENPKNTPALSLPGLAKSFTEKALTEIRF